MRSERLCSLARYLMADAANAPMTASTQWLERTLDDSANRRISMPEGFLCADAILRLAQNITAGLRVNEAIVDRSIREYLPYLATENLMMEAVRRGGDRQALHELIRRCSMEAAQKLQNGEPSDLIPRLAATGEFGMSEAEMLELLSPENYIGRCKEQVEAFLERNRSVYASAPGGSEELNV
jgi:adenylosuccinate lyase